MNTVTWCPRRERADARVELTLATPSFVGSKVSVKKAIRNGPSPCMGFDPVPVEGEDDPKGTPSEPAVRVDPSELDDIEPPKPRKLPLDKRSELRD